MRVTAYDAINDALEICSDLKFEMVPGFATHWPMGAETLIRLGHPERVHEWAVQYPVKRRHLPTPDPIEKIDAEVESSWRTARGDFRRATDWLEMFVAELDERSWRAVLLDWWPRLIGGAGAGLTHGLIRTTHAVRSIGYAEKDPSVLQLGELATALAYWAGMYVEQPGPARLSGTSDVQGVLAALPRLNQHAKIGFRDRGLFLHMATLTGWDSAVVELAPPTDVESALSDITAAFVQVNLAHPDQFPIPLLHTVSAPAALRLMLPHLSPELHIPSFVAVWKAITAVLATFAPARAEEVSDPGRFADENALAPEELRERAAEHGDEHAMKFTEACLREYAIRPDRKYLVAATRLQSKLPRYFPRNR